MIEKKITQIILGETAKECNESVACHYVTSCGVIMEPDEINLSIIIRSFSDSAFEIWLDKNVEVTTVVYLKIIIIRRKIQTILVISMLS